METEAIDFPDGRVMSGDVGCADVVGASSAFRLDVNVEKTLATVRTQSINIGQIHFRPRTTRNDDSPRPAFRTVLRIDLDIRRRRVGVSARLPTSSRRKRPSVGTSSCDHRTDQRVWMWQMWKPSLGRTAGIAGRRAWFGSAGPAVRSYASDFQQLDPSRFAFRTRYVGATTIGSGNDSAA